MSTLFDDDVLIHRVMTPGLDGNGITNPEAIALRNDLDALLERPVIDELDDIPNVSADSPDDGDTLVYNDATDMWESGSVSGAIARVDDHNSAQVEPDVHRLTFDAGLTARRAGAGWAAASVRFAGSGSASTAARSDHTHTIMENGRAEFGPQGYMASGTRQLVSTSLPLASKSYRIYVALRVQVRGGDPGPCYYRLAVTIDGNTRQSPSGTNGFWCVQGVPNKETWDHVRRVDGNGSAITISASIAWGSGGGGFNTDAGDLLILIFGDR